MKKVLFISSLYMPHVGGIETMIREMAGAYRQRGIESIVLTKRWPADLSVETLIEGVNVYRIPNARTTAEFSSIIEWIKSHEDKIRADVIHVIGMRRPMPLIALLLSRRWNVPLICTIAGGDIPDSYDANPGVVWRESEETVLEAMEKCDALTSVSRGLTSEFHHFFPTMKKNVEDIYAGINLDLIKSIQPEKLFEQFIFSFRRLDPSKGINILISAFHGIYQRYPKLQLVIAGDGPERQRLESLVQCFGIGDRTRFLGTISLERGIALLKSAVMTIVPSLSEGGGLVNIEAQAAGCPVVASNVGGIPEYVSNNESGLLFSSGDTEGLAEKMMTILDDTELRERLIKGGFAHSEKFDWKTLVPQYLKLYEACITRRSSKSFVEASFEPDGKASTLWQQLIL